MWKLLLAILPVIHAPGALASPRKPLDKIYEQFLGLNTDAGFEGYLDLMAPDGQVHETIGPTTTVTSIRSFVQGYKVPLGNVATWDARWVVLKASGNFVTFQLTNFGIFKSGCEFSFWGFAFFEFNDDGLAVFHNSHLPNLGNFGACAAGETPQPLGTLMPTTKMPKGFDELYSASKGLGDEGGLERMTSLMTPDAVCHAYIGDTKFAGGLIDFFNGYKTSLGELSDWQTNWQVLLTTEFSVTFSFAAAGSFKDGCKFDLGGYGQYSFNEEGQVTYEWQHLHDLGDFTKCAAQQPVSTNALEPVDKAGVPVPLVAALGMLVGILFSAAVVVLVGQRKPQPKPGMAPLLQ